MKSRNGFIQPYLQIALLLLAVIALYAGSLSAPLVFDDFAFFTLPDTLSKYGQTYFSLDSRWLPYASLARTVNWLGFDIFWLRFGNVLLHAANAIALFFFLKRLFQVTLTNHDDPHGIPTSLTWFAFFGALIFALHPVAVYGVAYLIQRSTLMATLFILLMLRVYLEGLLRGGWHWMLAAVLFYIAAVYSKEHSIAAPGVALAMTFLIRKPSAALLKQTAPYAILLALIAALVIYIYSAKGILGIAYEPNATVILYAYARMQGLTDLPNIYLLSILTQSWLFFKYLWLWLAPNPAWMSVDMREPFAMSLFGWPHTIGLIAFLAYFCAAVWLLLKQGKMGLLGFALLFPWILFLTEFSTVRAQEPFVLYRSYLWMPGLFAALPVVFGWIAPKRAFILLGVVSLLLIPLTLNRLNTFSSSLLLWDDAEKLVRDKPYAYGVERIYFNRGTELGQLKRYDEAIADFSRAIAANPFDFMYGNRATAYYFLGKYQEALGDFDRAIALNPDNSNSYNGRALTYLALGNFMAAQEDFKKSCALGLCPQNQGKLTK
jgi:tetratricopeptide (TPR) repeat protein